MLYVDAFVIRGHEKVIDHYRRLLDSAKSELERRDLQRRMDKAGEELQAYLEQRLPDARRAA